MVRCYNSLGDKNIRFRPSVLHSLQWLLSQVKTRDKIQIMSSRFPTLKHHPPKHTRSTQLQSSFLRSPYLHSDQRNGAENSGARGLQALHVASRAFTKEPPTLCKEAGSWAGRFSGSHEQTTWREKKEGKNVKQRLLNEDFEMNWLTCWYRPVSRMQMVHVNKIHSCVTKSFHSPTYLRHIMECSE